jgi:hypothetical protein
VTVTIAGIATALSTPPALSTPTTQTLAVADRALTSTNSNSGYSKHPDFDSGDAPISVSTPAGAYHVCTARFTSLGTCLMRENRVRSFDHL